MSPPQPESVPVADDTRTIPRLSWRAIIAGAIAAIAIHLLLTTLGFAIGMDLIPESGAQSLAIGAGLWWLISGSIALFCGGWIAGHTNRSIERKDAMLQGFLQWGVVTGISALLVTSALGSLLGGALQLTGQIGQAAGATVQAVIPQNVTLPGSQQVPWQRVERQIKQLIDSYAPQSVEDGNVQFVNLARTFLTSSESERQERREELLATLRQDLGITEAESQQLIQELEQTWQRTQQEISQVWQQTQETVVEAAGTTAETTSTAAWWTFASLLLGAILGTVGGAVGATTGGPLLVRRTTLQPITT